MKSVWLRRAGACRLVLFFSGFASDENLLNAFPDEDCDLLMFCDYTDLNFEFEREIFDYSEVYTAAWSFGVWVADYFKGRLPKSEMRVALCGSPYPVDDSRGIPEKVFEATCANYDSQGREKFFSRVFGAGNAELCARFKSKRSAESERAELISLGKAFKKFAGNPDDWDRAIAAKGDKIFPLKNLRAAWGEKLELAGGEHFPLAILKDGFRALFVDAKSVERGFEKSFERYEKAAGVQRKIARHLAKLTLKRIEPESIKEVLEIGVGTGFLTLELSGKLSSANWHLNDLSARALDYVPQKLRHSAKFLRGDAQIMELPKNLDLVLSASCFQWFENLEKFIQKIADSSNAGAVFAFSTFLPDNFREIRSLCGKGLNYIGIVGLKAMLMRAGFEVLRAEAETIRLEFKTPVEVLKHMRDTGVTGGFSEFWTPRKLREFSKGYTDFFASESGGVYLTYRPVYFVCKYIGKDSVKGQ